MGEIVGVDADAVPAHQPRREVQKVPLGAGGVENVVRGEPQRAEDLRDLVDEGSVDVALGVLDDLGGLAGPVVAPLQLVDPRLADVVARRVRVVAQGGRKGQAHVTQTDDRDAHGMVSVG